MADCICCTPKFLKPELLLESARVGARDQSAQSPAGADARLRLRARHGADARTYRRAHQQMVEGGGQELLGEIPRHQRERAEGAHPVAHERVVGASATSPFRESTDLGARCAHRPRRGRLLVLCRHRHPADSARRADDESAGLHRGHVPRPSIAASCATRPATRSAARTNTCASRSSRRSTAPRRSSSIGRRRAGPRRRPSARCSRRSATRRSSARRTLIAPRSCATTSPARSRRTGTPSPAGPISTTSTAAFMGKVYPRPGAPAPGPTGPVSPPAPPPPVQPPDISVGGGGNAPVADECRRLHDEVARLRERARYSEEDTAHFAERRQLIGAPRLRGERSIFIEAWGELLEPEHCLAFQRARDITKGFVARHRVPIRVLEAGSTLHRGIADAYKGARTNAKDATKVHGHEADSRWTGLVPTPLGVGLPGVGALYLTTAVGPALNELIWYEFRDVALAKALMNGNQPLKTAVDAVFSRTGAGRLFHPAHAL
jgi:hypothetical protein